MKRPGAPSFLYPSWGRAIGLIIMFLGIIIFLRRVFQYDIIDLAGGSFPLAMGLMMIFFSKEKDFDERIVYLKFKALAAAVPLAAVVTMIINYIKNYGDYSIENNAWFSISAFEYLTIVLAIAIGWLHYLKLKE
jgi:hypothetical protein